MPRVAQYQAAELSGFSKGLNLHADSSRLEGDELAEATNVRLGPRGEVQLRTGYLRQDVNLPGEIHHLYPWRTFGSVDHIVVVDNLGGGTIWHSEQGGTFIDSGHDIADSPSMQSFGVGFAGAKKKLYVSAKGMTDPVSFNGTTWEPVPTMPSTKMLFYRHGRMFAINDNERPSGVYFSEILDPEAFATDDYLEVNPDDGYQINAATVFGDDLVLFKDNAVWKLSGRTPSSFALYEIDSHRGMVAPKAHAQLRSRLFFFDRDTGIWAFDGAGFELVSQPINDYLLAGQNYQLSYISAMYSGEDRIYLSVPWQSGGYRTFVYFGDTGGWTEYDTGFNDSTAYLDVRWLGLPGAPGVNTAEESAHTVPPSLDEIVGKFRTGWTLIAGPGMKARVRRLEMTFKGYNTSSVTLRMYADYDLNAPVVERTFVGGVNPTSLDVVEQRVALDGWGDRVHAVAFEFETDGWPFQLNDLTVFYTGGVDLRGER